MEVLTSDTINPEAQSTAAGPASGSRCQHRYKNGKHCRLPGSEPQLGLCPLHFRQRLAAGLPACDDFSDLSKDLLRGPHEFSSAEDLREYLTRLLILMTKGGVSPRRAAVLAYITTQLLHSHVAAEKESAAEEPQFILDLPRPKRDDDISPERAMVNRWAERCSSGAPQSEASPTPDRSGGPAAKGSGDERCSRLWSGRSTAVPDEYLSRVGKC